MTGQVTYRAHTDKLRDRLRALGSPQSAVESTLIIEIQTNLSYADRARRQIREMYQENPMADARGFYEEVASFDGIADGVLFALEILRGVRFL